MKNLLRALYADFPRQHLKLNSCQRRMLWKLPSLLDLIPVRTNYGTVVGLFLLLSERSRFES